MDSSLRTAIAASVVIHSIAFIPFYHIAMPSRLKTGNFDMVVDYVAHGRAQAAVDAPAVYSRIKSAASTQVRTANHVKLGPNPASVAAEVKEAPPSMRNLDSRIADKEAKIKSTPGYAGYYRFIRQNIRERLKANYKACGIEGDVRLIFVLDRHGALVDVNIDEGASAADPALRGIAVSSLREASPFPQFPSALSLPRMSFDVVISFRKIEEE